MGSSVFTAGMNSRGVDVCLGRHDTPLAFSDSGDTAAQPQTPVMRLWAMGDLTHSTHDGTLNPSKPCIGIRSVVSPGPDRWYSRSVSPACTTAK